MGKFKKVVSVFASAAVAASMFSALTLSAAAKTAVYSNTWEGATETGFSNVAGSTTTTVTDFGGTTGTSVGMYKANATRQGTAKLTFNASTSEHISFSFDTYLTDEGQTKYIAIGSSAMGQMAAGTSNLGAVNTTGVVLDLQNYGNGKISVNGNSTNIDYGQWLSVSATADMTAKTMDITIKNSSGTTLYANKALGFRDATVTEVSAITLNANYSKAANPNPAVYIDNLYVDNLLVPSIVPATQLVNVQNGAPVVAASVSDAATIKAESSDESAVKASVNGSSVYATYVSEGAANITVTATSADGIEKKKSIYVIAGTPKLRDVSVKYVDSDKNEIAQGYTLNNQVVGATIRSSDISYEDRISTDNYRYTDPSVSDYTVVESANTIEVVYANKAAAVKEISINYVNDETTVASKNVDISASKLYVGDPYTYISTAYVKNTNNVIYNVADTDITENHVAADLNNSPTPVHDALRKSVTLATPTTITYPVAVSKNAVFYSEWEDILNTTASNYDTGRYIASGGKMLTTTTKSSFYTVPADGYYQVILLGGPKGRGTAIYASSDIANAATSAADGTQILNLSTGSNSDVYGVYAAATVYLNKDNNLTLRGFGSSGTTDNLDYVVVKRIISGNVVGAAGVSIIPGGQTAKYSFDSGVDAIPTWSVTGVSGVTIDQNGVLTVAADAAKGTATVKAEIESAELNGTKDVTIDKATVADFTFNAPAVLSLGSDSTYSISGVKDQFGADITAAATAQYSSSDTSVLVIDDSTGVATPLKEGSATVTVKVSVGDAEKTKTQYVTVKSLYITGTTSTVDASNLVTSGNITGYRLTRAKDGAEVDHDDYTTIPSTVDMTGADSWEIDPIYTYEIPYENRTSYTSTDIFADGRYNMTFTKGDASRADINVNGKMVGNNVDQYGWGRSNSAGTEYSINDVVVSGGKIAITLSDNQSAHGLTKAVIVKAPSNVVRKHKVYVIGDSLVANYYGTYTETVGSAQTGWGQQLSNFVASDWEVVNFANSGNYAAGLQTDAHPGVMAMIQPGDWYVIESGYNDANYPEEKSKDERKTIMYNAVKEMTIEAEAKGAHVVLVSPNASSHDFGSSVQYGSQMEKVYNDLAGTYGSNLTYVNLSKLSYDFIVGTGISTKYTNGGVLVQANFDGERFVSAATSTVAAGGFVPAANITADKYFVWDAISGDTALNKAATEITKSEVTATYNNPLPGKAGDTLHSAYVAAMKWAEIVAQGMKDAGADFINTKFSYTFTDTIGNNITCQVK